MVKLSAFASIYLLASITHCSLFFWEGGTVTCFAKITRVVFSGLWEYNNTTFFANRPISLYHK